MEDKKKPMQGGSPSKMPRVSQKHRPLPYSWLLSWLKQLCALKLSTFELLPLLTGSSMHIL